jgi:tyrosyl-tRNA synthetase
VPTDVSEVLLSVSALDAQGMISAIGLLKGLKLCASTGEAIRLVEQGGAYVYHGEEKVRLEAGKQLLKVENGTVVRAGKKKTCRVKLDPKT